MIRFIAFIGLVIACATPASAANWQFVSRGADGIFWADVDSIVQPAGTGIAKVWVKNSFKPKPGGPSYYVARWEFNCPAHTSRTSLKVYYKADGSLVRNYSTPFEAFVEIIPDSVGQMVETLACANSAS